MSWLDSIFDDLKRKHGASIIKPLSELTRLFSRNLTTTYPELDVALHGGLLRGQLVEFIGRNSNGMSTVMLRIVASVQKRRQLVAYIDCSHTFDPSYAARHGVDVKSLVLVRPQHGQMALSIADSLIAYDSCKLVVFDGLDHALSERDGLSRFEQHAYRLALATRRKQASVLFLNTPQFRYVLEHGAGVRLGFRRQRWLWYRGDVVGCRTRVTVMKNRNKPEKIGATLEIYFNPTAETDTSWWA